MASNDNQYHRKAQYNSKRETYVDENGNYVYRRWDDVNHRYREEVCVVGEGGFTAEIRNFLDEMDADEEHYLDVQQKNRDKIFDRRQQAYAADKCGHISDPIDFLPQTGQRTFDAALRDDPRVGHLLRAMEQLTTDQVDLIYAIYGEMKYGADVALEQGVSRQAINNRLKKIHSRLTKLMADMNED